MTYPFDEEDMTGEDTSAEEVFLITRTEACALLQECKRSWFSYENATARKLIIRLMDFVEMREVFKT